MGYEYRSIKIFKAGRGAKNRAYNIKRMNELASDTCTDKGLGLTAEHEEKMKKLAEDKHDN